MTECPECGALVVNGGCANKACGWLAPGVTAPPPEITDEGLLGLLDEAQAALTGIALTALTIRPTLDTPYADAPNWTPWTRWLGPSASRAHDKAMEIRKVLRARGHPRSRRPLSLPIPPVEAAELVPAALAVLHMAGITTGAGFERATAEAHAAVTP